MDILIADNQDITYEGLASVCSSLTDAHVCRIADKASLIERLKTSDLVVVIIDYTLFDINDVEELLILSQRFINTKWVLFSEELSRDFVRQIAVVSQNFSIVLKESPLYEIKAAVNAALKSTRFICQHTAEMLILPEEKNEETVKLTRTEKEILRDIASGMTTKEIAEKRISSFHTVNTHRKNIFRKLGVNNVHEAKKYALRAGLVDSAEYYI